MSQPAPGQGLSPAQGVWEMFMKWTNKMNSGIPMMVAFPGGQDGLLSSSTFEKQNSSRSFLCPFSHFLYL